MGEGFIIRRGGGSQQTVKPIYNSLTSVDFTSLTLNVTNDSNSIATLYYSVVNNEPAPDQANTFDTEFAGKETKDITITGLTQGTTYTVYLKAIAAGEFPSETVIVPGLTTTQPIVATGGTITNIGGYRYHTFTGNGTFSVSNASVAPYNQIDYLIVAGGGGGGGEHGAGGGAGGLLTNVTTTPFTINAQNYTITVGNGGASGGFSRPPSPIRGGQGGNSSAFGLTAIGGGGGGGRSNSGGNGGSGGGGNNSSGGTGTAGQGNNGGQGANEGPQYNGGGGGGAGAVGASAFPQPNDGNGGNGLNLSTYFPNWGTNSSNTTAGTRGWFAGGGGGCALYSVNGRWGIGGIGGGARGATNTAKPLNGIVNTGGGGGGANRYATGGSHQSGSIGAAGTGGSGIVIIRYEIAPV